MSEHHSRYGGLWLDRADWREQLAIRCLCAEQSSLAAQFAENGFVILRDAVSHSLIDRFRHGLDEAFRLGDPDVFYERDGDQEGRSLTEPAQRFGARVVDAFVPMASALDLFATPALLRALTTIFGESSHLFHSLAFSHGSGQGLHQDTAYVVVDRPLELAACWIALEDVREGSGELMYVPGSHRLPDFDFGADTKHWEPVRDGMEVHDRWSATLRDDAASRGVKTFLANKGDILIWHADMVHGGKPIQDPSLTRHSLVGHFCPRSATPHSFRVGAKRDTVLHHRGLAYSSAHYDLRTFRQDVAA